jgi:hypothetical protein
MPDCSSGWPEQDAGGQIDDGGSKRKFFQRGGSHPAREHQDAYQQKP